MNLKFFQRGLAAYAVVGGLSFVTCGAAWAADLPKGVVQGPSVEGITEYRLPNGLKVLLFPDASRPTITVNVTYLVGSRHENYGETGMAHLLEHLMFKGSKGHPDITRQFSDRGMQFNGTTSFDRTNYYEVFQASQDNLDWALRMEADRMTHSFIAKKDLDSEMTVVRNEYENGENSPTNVLMKRMQSVAFDWHAYSRMPIGNKSDIENVKIENLQAFYRTYYQPDNAVLLVAGKFDAGKTLASITTLFGAIPKPKRTLPQFWTVEPTQDGERSFTVRRQGDMQVVMLGYKIPASLHADSNALNYASTILGDTPTGRLHKLLVDSGKASQVFAFPFTGYAPGLEYVGAVVKKDEDLAPVREALTQAVEGFAKNPPTPEEMERAKRAYLNEVERNLADPAQVGLALSETIALGDWRLFFAERDSMAKVTSEQVASAASRYFRRDNRVTGSFIPDEDPQRAVVPPAPSLQSVLKDFKPQVGASNAEDFDPSQANIMKRTTVVTAGGVKLALLPKKNRGQTVTVSLRQHMGDEKNLFGKATAQGLSMAMLTRGTSKYSRTELADAFEKLKFAGDLHQFQTTRENLPEALKLVAHVLREANFPAAEFEQMRKQALVGLEASRNEPPSVATRALNQHFNTYPKGDPRYTPSLDETIAEIKAATLDDVKAFHRDYYGTVPAEIAIVGDFDAKAVEPLVDQLFGAWKAPMAVAPVLEKPADIQPIHEVLNTPEKENGFYVARLNLDLNIDDPDYPALMLADYIFGGGGLKSRLMDRIRQKDGLSYGGSSYLAPGDLDRAGKFGIQAIAAPQNLAKVDAAVREELERVRKDGFTAAELAGAKSGLLQQRIQTRATDDGLASGWTNYLYLGRTFTWSAEFEKRLAAVTLPELNAAFRKAIDPAKLSVVMAGDRSKMGTATKPAP
ncbi:M16 family metallopeptidase [Massilia sp. TN1-12]|uniref:M16 family metallopeptidase n=1 Tax=Massilia paldalensis TaxID=3377675 RepID=UPI00384B78DA